MIASDMTSQEFGALFMKYRDRFVSIAKSYVKDSVVAEDIVADAFTKFWGGRTDVIINTLPESYILQTVKNKCLNHLRDKMTRLRIQQQMHTNTYKVLEKETEMLSSENLSFLFETDITQIFNSILKDVPDLSKEIFISSRFHGMTYREISEKLNISERKVKREIQKVLELMRIGLKDYTNK